MPTDTYSIVDLARLTGVNVRTIRYYLAQGLLRASGESGPGAHYGEGHLDRLRLTRRLQQQHLPLAEIRRRLAELTDSDVSSVLATTKEPEPGPTTSALDYVRTVLGAPTVMPSMAPAVPGVAPRAMRPSFAAAKAMVSASSAMVAETPLASLAEAEPTETDEPPGPERSQWERLSLGPNVEIHIRRPLSRLEQRRVERLLTIARQVLKEETP